MNEYNSPLWRPTTQHNSNTWLKENARGSTLTKQSSDLMSQKEESNLSPRHSSLDQ